MRFVPRGRTSAHRSGRLVQEVHQFGAGRCRSDSRHGHKTSHWPPPLQDDDLFTRFNVGYQELVRANPGVDPWLPGAGTPIVLPTEFVLPDAPRDNAVAKRQRELDEREAPAAR